MADLEMAATVAARGLDVGFSVAAGEVLAVVGPNGAGKSTTAAVLAGLVLADRAVVRIGDRTLTDTTRGVNVPVHDRRVGLLMQDSLLFPHMSVLGNVQFATRRHSDAGARARYWLEQVGAADLADRRPTALSGGQSQRVALARALAADPEVLILDEPFAGLDVAAATAIRVVLRRVLAERSRPVILITHDLLDVVGMANRAMVLEGGRVAEIGTVSDLLRAPRSGFGARFVGVNLVPGLITGPGELRSATGRAWRGVADEALAAGSDAVAVFAPASVSVYRECPGGSPRNALTVRITGLEVNGGTVRMRAAEPGDDGSGLAADITGEALAELGLAIGDPAWFTVKAQEVSLHAARRPAPRAG